jgi:hypothetical protein
MQELLQRLYGINLNLFKPGGDQGVRDAMIARYMCGTESFYFLFLYAS